MSIIAINISNEHFKVKMGINYIKNIIAVNIPSDMYNYN